MDDVKFGGGLLGHLEKGGQFKVQRGKSLRETGKSRNSSSKCGEKP
jgi:hypothetical protein